MQIGRREEGTAIEQAPGGEKIEFVFLKVGKAFDFIPLELDHGIIPTIVATGNRCPRQASYVDPPAGSAYSAWS
jgi:hypothetical protein